MKTLERNVINVWGDHGREWLKNLPKIIAELSEHWQLSDVTPIVNKLSYNFVATAKQHHNIPVVLKFSCDSRLIEDEYRALTQFDGMGSIQVIDREVNHHALLLEQAIPGTLLKENYPRDIEDTIKIYACVVKVLAFLPKPETEYTHVSTWCRAIDRISDPRITPEYISKAKELKSYLLSNANEYLCHGDLHLENIIQHDGKWLTIDPKGMIGEMAFEAAAFDLIDKSEWAEIETITNKINHRLSLLANRLDIPEDRLRAWVFLRVIISAQWFIEDNGDPDEMLRLADVLYPTLNKRYHKENVCLTYEKISDWYDEHRCKDLIEKHYLDKIIEQLPEKGSILDLGCGTGQPIAEYFIKHGVDVTGIDGSQLQINKAKKLVPEMHAICNDMRHIHLEKQFDCIIAWHSFFHLTQNDQRTMFDSFKQHIKPGGLLVFTSGTSESEVWSDNGGEMLYHASLSEEEYRELLTKHNFTVLHHKVNDPKCGEATVWIAKYTDKKDS